MRKIIAIFMSHSRFNEEGINSSLIVWAVSINEQYGSFGIGVDKMHLSNFTSLSETVFKSKVPNEERNMKYGASF